MGSSKSRHNGGPAEFVKHEDTGLTVSDDHDAIGWGVGTVLANRAQGHRMGRRGRKEAETRFSWNTVAAATERVYRSIMSCRFTPHQELEAQEEVPGMARQGSGKPKTGASKTRQPKQKADMTTKTAETAKKATGMTAKPPVTRTRSKSSQTTRRSKLPPALATGNGPASEEIRQRAYEIYLARHGAPGDPVRDWLQAERELREQLVLSGTG